MTDDRKARIDHFFDTAARPADAPPPMPTQSGMVEEPEPTAWRREWDGDVSDLGQFVYAERGDDLDNLGIWEPLYGTETVETLRTLLAAALKEREQQTARVDELESQASEMREMLSNKFAIRFQVKHGFTIVDFMRLWLEQERERGAKLLARAEASEHRATSAERALENERMKVAGCSTAAMGAWKEGDTLHPDYECAAIHDVARLYVRADSAERALGEMRAQNERVRAEALEEAAMACDVLSKEWMRSPQEDSIASGQRLCAIRIRALSGAKGDGGDK